MSYDWVRAYLEEWARHWRRSPVGWPRRSMAGRLVDEGAGASNSRPGSSTPQGVEFMSSAVRMCDMAFKSLPEECQNVIEIRFLLPERWMRAEQLKQSRISRAHYHNLLNQAYAFISGYFSSKS